MGAKTAQDTVVATYTICARSWSSGSLSSAAAFIFSLTVKISVSTVTLKSVVYNSALTQHAHDVLALPKGIEELLVAALERRLLRIVNLLQPRRQDIRVRLQPLDLRDRHEVQKEAAEPSRPEVRQVRRDLLRPDHVTDRGAK